LKLSALRLTAAALLLSWLVLANFLLKTYDSWFIYAFILATLLIGVCGCFMHLNSRAVKDLRYVGQLSQDIKHHGKKAFNTLPVDKQPEAIRPLVETLQQWTALEEDRLAQEHAFTSEASHELRSPLTGMRLQAQIAQKTKDPKQQEIALNQVLKAIDRSTHLVEQLLTLSRLTRRYGEDVLEATELISLTQSIADQYREKARNHNVTLELISDNRELTVHSKDELITTLLDILLDNALRYTPSNGFIRISLKQQDKALATLIVEDSGPGIPPEQYDAVQAPFQKSRDGVKQGAGLGLAIVKRIAELHDSMLRLDKSPLGGLQVSTNFTLRDENMSASSSTKPMIPAINSGGKRADLPQQYPAEKFIVSIPYRLSRGITAVAGEQVTKPFGT